MSNFLEIDGSLLEGGGQILRLSVAFSTLLGIPIKVTKIRAGRSKPGLAAQHLKGIQLVAQMCQAKAKGFEIGSTEIEFTPGKIKGGEYTADTQTAGAISLLLQVALPVSLLADEKVTLDLRGGTNADMAPQIDYITEIFRPTLERFGATFDFELHRRGYYPRGGGHVTVTIDPVRHFRAVNLTDPGQVDKVYGWSFVAGSLPVKMAHLMAEAAEQELRRICNNIDIECYKESRDMAPDNCNGMVIAYSTSSGCVVGASCLGRRGLSPASLGKEVAERLAGHAAMQYCLDDHAQDQVIMWMALAEGKSAVRVGEITLHTKTAMLIATTMTKVQFNVIPCGKSNIIECTGLGLVNKNLPSR